MYSLIWQSVMWRPGKLRFLITAGEPITARGIVPSHWCPFRQPSPGTRRSMIGETPEWLLWLLVGILALTMLLPGLKR
jgi:hypothetical protein